jgi:hypothetical protein
MSTYFRLLRFLRPHLGIFGMATGCMAVSSLLGGLELGAIIPLADRIITNQTIPSPAWLPGWLVGLVQWLNSVPQLSLLTGFAMAIPVLFLNVLYAATNFWSAPSGPTAFAAIVAAALLVAAFFSRVMALTVQDRVIRLEMRLRLREVLPSDLQGRLNELTREQFVALRFAGDAELPALVREVLAGKLTTQKAIKERVKDWQGDYLRA